MSDQGQNRQNSKTKIATIVLGPVICLAIILFGNLDPGHPKVTYTFAVAVLMAIWWIFESIPLAATSLVPVVLFPLLGILDGKTVSALYFNHLIFLFIGGFLVSLAMQKWNLHKRIAIRILLLFGVSPGRILMGFMLATAFISMWMSNTATAMMMIPIALSIIVKLEEALGKEKVKNYAIGLLLSIAYSASIGGIATLVGTPTNLSFVRIVNILFPKMPEISFAEWLIFAIWLSVIILGLAWLILYYRYRPDQKWEGITKDDFRKEYQQLGKTKPEEKIVFVLFILMVILWVFRTGFDFGTVKIPGWSLFFKNSEYVNDGTVAIAIALIMFTIPSRTEKGEMVLTWNTAKGIPWHIVLLFGGGFALAQGFVESGLSAWFGQELAGLRNIPPIFITLIIVTVISFLTELTSNTATAEMILPIVAGLSVSIHVNPLLLMIPATLAASMAFMLPVATPPNAIVFATNHVKIKDMVRTGFLLNMASVVVITLLMYYWGKVVFGIDTGVFPDWAAIVVPSK